MTDKPTHERCHNRGFVHLGDNNTGQSYRCDEWGRRCPVLDYYEAKFPGRLAEMGHPRFDEGLSVAKAEDVDGFEVGEVETHPLPGANPGVRTVTSISRATGTISVSQSATEPESNE